MPHEARRLVHDQQELVLEHDGDGDILAGELALRELRLDPLSAPHPVRRTRRLAVYPQRAFAYYALNCAAAGVEAAGGQAVEALPGLGGVHVEGVEGQGLAEVAVQGASDLGGLEAVHEERLVPARGATDHGDVRARDPEQLGQEALDLGVCLAVHGQSRDPDLDCALSVGAFYPGRFRPRRHPEVEEGASLRRGDRAPTHAGAGSGWRGRCGCPPRPPEKRFRPSPSVGSSRSPSSAAGSDDGAGSAVGADSPVCAGSSTCAGSSWTSGAGPPRSWVAAWTGGSSAVEGSISGSVASSSAISESISSGVGSAVSGVMLRVAASSSAEVVSATG